MNKSPSPTTGLAMIVSKQLMPHILCALHSLEGTEPRPSVVVLLHTDDKPKSKRPATRLKRFLQRRIRQNPDLAVAVEMQEISTKPWNDHPNIPGTEQLISFLQHKFGPSKWVLNATGGLKLMAFGVTRHTANESVKVVYRELNPVDEDAGIGNWVEVYFGEKHLMVRAADMLDKLPENILPQDLVEAQTDLAEGQRLEAVRAIESKEVIPPFQAILDKATEEQPNGSRLNLKAALIALGCACKSSTGVALEYFVARILMDLGFDPYISLKIVGDGRPPTQEVDVVFMANGRLHIVDCKLVEDEERDKAITQLHTGYSTRERFGGLDAKYVLLRPNLDFPPDFTELLRLQRLDFWGQDRQRTMASDLADWIGVDEPVRQRALAMDAAIGAALDAGAPLFGSGFDRYVEKAKDRVAIDLARHQKECMADAGISIFSYAGFCVASVPSGSTAAANLFRAYGQETIKAGQNPQTLTWTIPERLGNAKKIAAVARGA